MKEVIKIIDNMNFGSQEIGLLGITSIYHWQIYEETHNEYDPEFVIVQSYYYPDLEIY